MRKFIYLIIFLFINQVLIGQANSSCAGMDPICTNVGLNFTANTGVADASAIDPGNNYGCLFTSPNPTWYYLEISNSGPITMQLSAGSDIDFIIWGPFTNLANAIANCGTYNNIVPDYPAGCGFFTPCTGYGCSYSSTNVETPHIQNAVVGEVYVMLITNYANTVQQISLTQTGGTGATDCSIVNPCDINFIDANLTTCNTATGTFDISGQVQFTNPPTSGQLIIQNCSGDQAVINAPFTSPINYSINGIVADGTTGCTVSATFTADPTCTLSTNTFTEPTCPCALTYVDNIIQSTCGIANGEITLTASNGTTPYQYSIDGGVTFQLSGTFTGLFAGVYNIVINDAAGCQVTGTVTVTDQGGPSINSTVTTDETCFGACDGTIVINSTGGAQFSIDNGATFQSSNSFAGLCAGTYDIVVEDNFGCQTTDQVTISPLSVITATIISVDILCNGNCTGEIMASAQGGTPPYQYSIDNGITFQSISNITGLCSGVYDVIVQDANGCQTMGQNVQITEPSLLTMTLGVTDETCFGACDGMINSIPTGGTGAGTYTYNWTPAIGNVPLASNLCSGPYSLTVIDANGCSITADTVINGPQAVNINSIVEVDELCGGDCMGSITINATGATQYSLDGITFQVSNVFANLCAGNYVVYVSDINGCIATTSAVISGPAVVNIQAFSDTTICIGGSAQLDALCTGGVGGFTYAWDNGDLTQSITVSPTLDQIYCVIGTDANGCSSGQVCLTVTVNPTLNVSALSDQTICMGDNASISALATGGDGGPYTYAWDQGLGNGQNHTVNPTATTVYTVTATDGCETPSATASLTITVSPIPTISFTADTLEGCTPVATTFTSLNVPAGSQCLWNFGDGGVSTNCGPVMYNYITPGCWDVDLSVTTPEGCITGFNQAQYICVYEQPVASFTFGPQPTTITNPTIDFVNTSTGGTNYLWSFNEGGIITTSTAENPTYSFNSSQEDVYEVCLEVTNDEGCESNVCHTVVINEEFLVYVPNAFTPNGDHLNNEFYPVVTGVEILDYEFYIYNRWGELMFESFNEGQGWDGTYQGMMSKFDVYVWKLVVVDEAFKQKHEYVGHVLLLR